MITLAKVDSVVGGQYTPTVRLTVQKHDIIFVNCSYYHGGNPTLIADVVLVKEIGRSKVRSGGTYKGDIIGVVWEALEAGTLRITIHSDSMGNLDLYAVVFRPSSSTTNVSAYIKTRMTTDPSAWTEPLDVYSGEYLLCTQYCSRDPYPVDSAPVGAHKGGLASITTVDHALPETATSAGNSFVEVIRVNSNGTFKYYGPNNTVMRVTIQGDPIITRQPFGSFILI